MHKEATQTSSGPSGTSGLQEQSLILKDSGVDALAGLALQLNLLVKGILRCSAGSPYREINAGHEDTGGETGDGLRCRTCVNGAEAWVSFCDTTKCRQSAKPWILLGSVNDGFPDDPQTRERLQLFGTKNWD